MSRLEGQFRLGRGAFQLDIALTLSLTGVTGIFGESGCGKTTLLRCLAGLDRPDAGELMVGGQSWFDSRRGHFLAPHHRPIGMVFQEGRLFPHLNVRGNLDYGRRRKAQGRSVIGFDEVVELLELGPLLARRPAGLSGGEQQRVAIGRALLTQPELLLLDEPLAALDRRRKREIMPFLDRLHRELAIPLLYVSHSLSEITALADQLVLMEQGRVVAAGAVSELLTRLDVSLADDHDATSVVTGKVLSVDERYRLLEVATPFGSFWIPMAGVAIGDEVRLKILARDVSLCLSRPLDSSIINIFPARIIGIDASHDCHVNLRLEAGGTPLLSRVSHLSRERLGLEVGKELYAQVKGIAMGERG